jgi:hypothetical protein
VNEADRVALREKIRAQRRAIGQEPYVTSENVQRIIAAVLESHRRRTDKIRQDRRND